MALYASGCSRARLARPLRLVHVKLHGTESTGLAIQRIARRTVLSTVSPPAATRIDTSCVKFGRTKKSTRSDQELRMSNSLHKKIEHLLLGELSPDGSFVGNGHLFKVLSGKAAAEGFSISDADFLSVRESLLAEGQIIKGKGRGGSTALSPASAPDAAQFELGSSASSPVEPTEEARTKKPSNRRPATATASSSDPAQVISYPPTAFVSQTHRATPTRGTALTESRWRKALT